MKKLTFILSLLLLYLLLANDQVQAQGNCALPGVINPFQRIITPQGTWPDTLEICADRGVVIVQEDYIVSCDQSITTYPDPWAPLTASYPILAFVYPPGVHMGNSVSVAGLITINHFPFNDGPLEPGEVHIRMVFVDFSGNAVWIATEDLSDYPYALVSYPLQDYYVYIFDYQTPYIAGNIFTNGFVFLQPDLISTDFVRDKFVMSQIRVSPSGVPRPGVCQYAPFPPTLPTATPLPLPTSTLLPTPTTTPTPVGPFNTPIFTPTPTFPAFPTAIGGTPSPPVFPTATPIEFPTIKAENTPTPINTITIPTLAFPTPPSIPTIDFSTPVYPTVDSQITITPTATPTETAGTVLNSLRETVVAYWEENEDVVNEATNPDMEVSLGVSTTTEITATGGITITSPVASPLTVIAAVTRYVGLPFGYAKGLSEYMPNAFFFIFLFSLLALGYVFNIGAKYAIGLGKLIVEIIRRIWEAIPFN